MAATFTCDTYKCDTNVNGCKDNIHYSTEIRDSLFSNPRLVREVPITNIWP